jgi:DNA modification methylase
MTQFKVYNGNCLDVLRNAPDNFADSIVCDPPYGLAFMGKKWDYDVPSVEIWKECLRVLKPGGHLLAFGGTRTYHRLVVSIEDAGFEIRDQIQWIYGSGFPKSQNIQKEGLKKDLCCGCETQSEHDLRPVSESDISEAFDTENESGQVLQPCLSEHSASGQDVARAQAVAGRGQESGLEGRSNIQAQQRELRGSEIRSVSAGVSSNGSEGRVRDGAPLSHGQTLGQTADANRSGTSQRPQHPQQSVKQSGTVAGQRKPQARRSGEDCGECGKPIIPGGLGTALKPANEPICLARKPLSETTIAKNVLKHGTGGLNIDGTRVGTSRPASHMDPNKFKSWKETDGNERSPSNEPDLRTDIGRFPANVILDEDAAKVLDEQTGITGGGKFSKSGGRNLKGESRSFGAFDQKVKNAPDNYGDEGGASRFFYVAKASKSDRGEGNVHPTVKPIKLMEYLIKLVTPEGGIVLDPFMGSGTTGVAAVRNGFQFRGVELDEKYFHIAQARLEKEIV